MRGARGGGGVSGDPDPSRISRSCWLIQKYWYGPPLEIHKTTQPAFGVGPSAARRRMGGSRGETGGPDPLKNHKNIGFHSNTGPYPLKKYKATIQSQHSIMGHHRHVSDTPFKLRFAGGPMLARILWYLDPLSSHQLKKSQSLIPSGKTFWIRACVAFHWRIDGFPVCLLGIGFLGILVRTSEPSVK